MYNGEDGHREDNSYLTSAERTLNGGDLDLDGTTYQLPLGVVASGSQNRFDGSAFVRGEYYFIIWCTGQ